MEQRRKNGYDLRYLPIWSLYIDGARDILLRLKEEGVELFYDKSVPKDERAIYNRAVWDYLLSDKSNIDKYILRAGEGRFYFWAAFFGLSAFALAYVQHEIEKQEEQEEQ